MPEMTLHPAPTSNKFRTFALLAAVVAFTLAGCKGTSDATLTGKIQTTLAADSAIAGQPVQVAVKDGVVTLTGSVSNDAQRVLAARDAATVDGVKKVVDSIMVGTSTASVEPTPMPTPPSPQPTPAAPADTRKLPVTKPTPQVSIPTPQRQAAPIERPQEANNPPPAPPQPVPAPTPAPVAPPAPTFKNIMVTSGTVIPVRVTQTLDSASTQADTTFSGVVAADITIDGVVAIPAGSPVSGHVDAVQDAAHFKGSSQLTVSLSSITRRGEHLAVITDPYTVTGKGRGANTAEKTGGGAAVGAILGGIFGGGKGAAIGAVAGGGVGAGSQAVTRGQQVQIQSESVVRFHLSTPIALKVQTGGADKHTDDPGLEKRSNQ